MKNLFKLSFVILFFTILGCSSDQVECTTLPEHFVFQFIDKDSGENLFSNGTFDVKKQIIVISLKDARIIQLSNVNTENGYTLSIGDIGWINEKISYEIAFYQGKTIFSLNVDAERVSGKCNYTKYNSVQIINAGFELDKTTGIYKILIDTKK